MSQFSLKSVDRTPFTGQPTSLDRSSGTMSGRTVARGDANGPGRASRTPPQAPAKGVHARDVASTGSGPSADGDLSPRVAPDGSEIGKLEKAARTSMVTAEVLVSQNPSGKLARSISVGENLSAALDDAMSANLSSEEDFADVKEALGGIQARARSESRDLKGSGVHQQALRADLDSIADTAGDALDELADMAPPGGGQSANPLSERAVFKSKSFTTEGAIRVIDQVLNDPVDGPKTARSREVLEAAKAFLQDRQAGMLTGKADTALGKQELQALMGSHGANKGLGKVEDGVKAEIAGRLSTMDPDATDLGLNLPESLPGIREDGIMTMFLAKAFDKAGVFGPKDLERSLLKGRLDSINNQTWGRIDKQVEQRFATRTVQVDSSIAPQSQLGNIYDKMGGHGVNCHMAQSYDHVTNLAVTSAKVDDKVVFEGLRHGTLTAYKISSKELAKLSDAELTKMLKDLLPPNRTGDASIRTMIQTLRSKDGVLQKLGIKESSRKNLADELRGLATEKRAKDVITAALVKDPAKLAVALRSLQDGEAPRAQININSISLLTPTWKKGGDANERRMWRDQLAAWDKMNAGPVTLTVRDANGQDVDVQVGVKVNAFNFGVNKGAVGLAGTGTSILNLASGWGVTERQNTKSMNALIGDKKARKDGELGGEVGAWLRQAKAAPGGLADANKTAQVEALARQIATIWDDKGYRKEGREPYKIVSRLAVLTHMMGDDAAWNCKSGKDRTGECDTEAKYLATEIAATNTVPEPDRKRTADEKSNFFNMAVGGGNHELQDLNTGAPGFKLKDLPVIGTLMGDGEKSPEWTEFLGLSAYYGS